MPIINLVYEAPEQYTPRQPWANTLGYRPLTTTTTRYDQSGNSRDFTIYGSANFSTYDWVNCVLFTGEYRNNMYSIDITRGTLTGTQPFTYSYWLKVRNHNDQWIAWIIGINNTQYANDKTMVTTASGKISATVGATTVEVPSFTVGTRSLYSLVFDGTTLKIYQNWTLMDSDTCAGTSDTSTTLGLAWDDLYADPATSVDWYMSNLIIENKAWTDTDISNYFNDTKETYGIS